MAVNKFTTTRKGMKIKYITIDTRTLKGLKQAEGYKRRGWKIGSVGLFTIEFYKLVSR